MQQIPIANATLEILSKLVICLFMNELMRNNTPDHGTSEQPSIQLLMTNYSVTFPKKL